MTNSMKSFGEKGNCPISTRRYPEIYFIKGTGRLLSQADKTLKQMCAGMFFLLELSLLHARIKLRKLRGHRLVDE